MILIQRDVEIGMAVYVLNNHGTPKWLQGTIQQITGPASVLVKLRDGRTFCRHTIVWKYFVGKKFSWAMKSRKNFNTINNNKVYLCNCDIILEYYLH